MLLRGPPRILCGLLRRIGRPPLFLGGYRRPCLDRSATGGYYVLDDVTLLLGSPVAGGYGHHVPGAEGIVRVVDEEGLWVVEELETQRQLRLARGFRTQLPDRSVDTYLLELAVPCLPSDTDFHSPLHQPGCHYHPVKFAE